MRDNRSYRWQPLALLLVCAALVVPLGCEEGGGPAPAATQVSRVVVPSGPIDALSAPAEVMAHGGSDDFLGFAQRLTSMVGAPGKAVDLAGLAPGLARHLGLADASAIALDKPTRFALLDPSAHDEPAVLLLTARNRDQLVAGLPAERSQDQGHDAYAYPGWTKKPVYLNFLDDFAVFTHQAGQFAELRPFLLALAGAELDGEAAMVVSVAHVLAVHGKSFEAALAQARQSLAGTTAGPPSSSGTGFSALLDALARLSKALDRLMIRIRLQKDAATVALDVHPVAGSELAAALRRWGLEPQTKRPLDLLAKIPSNAPLALAWSMDADGDDELTRGLTAWSLQLSSGHGLDEAGAEAMGAYWKATNGQLAFAAHPLAGAEGLRFSALTGIRDGEAARKAQTQLRTMYQEPALTKLYQQMGVRVSYHPAAYRVGEVTVDSLSAELKPHQKATTELDLRTLGRTAALFTEMMSSQVAIGDDLGVISYGRDGRVAIEAWLSGKMPGGLDQSPGVIRARDRAAAGTFMLLYAQPLELLRAVELAPPGPPVSSAGGVALSAGAADGVLQLLLDVPASQAAALARAWTADRGAPDGQP